VTSKIPEGRAFRVLNEYIPECPNIMVKIEITSHQVMERLTDFFIAKGIVEHMRSDNGARVHCESGKEAVRKIWSNRTLFIESGTPGRMTMSSHSTESSGTDS
jgi:hypothetical protein